MIAARTRSTVSHLKNRGMSLPYTNQQLQMVKPENSISDDRPISSALNTKSVEKKKKKKKCSAEHAEVTRDSALSTLIDDRSSKKDKKHKKKRKSSDHAGDISDKNEKKKSKSNEVSAKSWLDENKIKISDPRDDNWMPFINFSDTNLSSDIMHSVKTFEKPTPIQAATWPITLKGRDIIGIAETGSGKTLAFAIPALSHLDKHVHENKKKAKVLALAPTRELAMQINEQFELAAASMDVSCISVYGGTPKEIQRAAFRKGVDVVIGCPGRLIDLIEEKSCNLSGVDYVVLDEADRMLDLGFEKEVRKILSLTNPNRQTIMFSATWPNSIQKLASEFLKDPVNVTVGSPDLGANSRITQIVEVVEPYEKDSRLTQLLNTYHHTRKNRILVFALYKKEAARLEQTLSRRGWKCVAIHGDMNQHERNSSFAKFKSGQVPLLIATDVAARGLDIPSVEYVINYTFPLTIEDYVHRIGRTGRAGKTGTSHTFFTVHDKARAGELNNLLRQNNQKVPEALLKFGTTVKKKEHSVYGAFYREIDTNVKPTKIVFDSDGE